MVRGDEFPFAISQIGQFVDHRFRHVGNYGEAAGHVAVERAVADGHLGFVAGAEHQRAEFIGQGHEQIAADARLDIFLGDVFGPPSEDARRSLR